LELGDTPGYRQFEYINRELPDVMAAASVAVSRSGANSVFEYLAIALPALLIPLEAGSRGDQVLNAEEFSAKGYSAMLREGDINTPDDLANAVMDLYDRRDEYIAAMKACPAQDSIAVVIDTIERFKKK
jgi:UDP-N-acetylglucosamine--N-acetylmuramyl-(pentapeptide) pyrophosphoryl-undecaprenol N-acetylglucosamine transferase